MKKFSLKNKSLQKGFILFMVGLLSGVLLITSFQHFQSSSDEKDTIKQETIANQDTGKEDKKTEDKKEDTTQDDSTQYPSWDKTAVYNGGDKVIYEKKIYKAKWWTQGETPGTSDVWEDTKESVTPVKEEKKNNAVSKKHVETGDKKIVGYFPSWKPAKVDDLRYDELTDIIYAFAIPTSEGDLRPLDNPDIAKQIITKAHKQNVRVLLAVGGWSYNDVPLESTFVSATENDQKTKKFGDAIIKMCNQYGFDGVDMDWEHPRVDGNTGKQYEALMLYLAEQLHNEKKLLTSAVLSGATADGNVYYDAAAHSDAVLKAVDRIHVMAYDGGDGERHSPYDFSVNCVEYWTNTRGVDPNKVILGVPFYARPSWAGYGDIIKENKDASKNDHVTYNGMDVYYNGLETMKKKAQYAKKKCGGIMIWELSQDSNDDKTSLLKVIAEELSK